MASAPLNLPRLLVLLAAAGALACQPHVTAEDWPCWRGPSHNGISTETGWTTDWPREGPRQLWRASVGIGFSSFAVAGGRVYTLGNTNDLETVFCLDALTGRTNWTYSYACGLDPQYYEGGPHATPTVDGDRVYTFSQRGQLFCFDAATGAVIWQKDLMTELGARKPRWGFAGSPLLQGDRLLLNLGSAGTAVFKASGRIAWTSDREAAGYATPVPLDLGGQPAATIFSSNSLVAVRVSDGAPRWRYPWRTKWDLNIADPIVAGESLFISTFGRGGALLRLTTGTPVAIWENQSMENHFNSSVLVGGYLYGVNGDSDHPERDLRCVEMATGLVKWRYEGLGLGSVFVANRHLVVMSDKGELVVAPVSPKAFKPVAQAQVLGGKCWTVPVLANGCIFCRNARGEVVCLDVRKP